MASDPAFHDQRGMAVPSYQEDASRVASAQELGPRSAAWRRLGFVRIEPGPQRFDVAILRLVVMNMEMFAHRWVNLCYQEVLTFDESRQKHSYFVHIEGKQNSGKSK